ncbi:MAG: Gfo/Idh/MocA family oxidoreductase [Myxococcota bacterium]
MTRVQRLKWAIVGVGVAGRARAKAIAGDPRAALVAVWRGRFAAEPGATVVDSLEAAIAAADVVAVCSPTAAHAEQVRAVLDAGRHALVEFPIAEDAATAEALFAHARAEGRVLHEEHIELLDAPSSTLSAHIRVETVKEITVSFEGPGSEDASPAELALRNVARLHRVAAVGGPFASIDRVTAEPGRLVAELRLRSGAPVRATFLQAPYYARRTALEVDTVASKWNQHDDQLLRDGMPVTLVGLGGLFARDQRSASARILDGSEPYVDERRILHVLDLVDRLGRLETGLLPQRSDAAGR